MHHGRGPHTGANVGGTGGEITDLGREGEIELFFQFGIELVHAAARRAGRLGDGFFPSIGAQVDTLPLLDIVRRSAEQAGRDPAKVELILGCPGALPNSGSDPRAAVEERIARGVGRVALPVTAFLPDIETTLARFGEEIIKPYANA